MEVTFLIADSAHVADGKLYLLGGGWTTVKVPAGQGITMALAAIVTVEWHETNEPVHIAATLQDEDGGVVVIDDTPVRVEAAVEVGRPPGAVKGSSFNAVLAIPFTQVRLDPGRYVWAIALNDEEYARRPFTVEALQPG